jgi:hypothetical protein
MTREPCTNQDGSPKRRFESRAAAEDAARRSNRQRRNDQPATAYRCPGTTHFHVGHGYEEDLQR